MNKNIMVIAETTLDDCKSVKLSLLANRLMHQRAPNGAPFTTLEIADVLSKRFFCSVLERLGRYYDGIHYY